MCSRLDSILACDIQTDGQTDIFPRHSPRYAYALRGKNELTNFDANWCNWSTGQGYETVNLGVKR